MTKFYMAAQFDEREFTQRIREPYLLRALPEWEATGSWIHGGEEGLSMAEIAILDLKDIDRADVLILFSKPRKGKKTTGRIAEFGYAFAKGKRCIVIGPYENVFMHHPSVEVYDSLPKFVAEEKKRNAETESDWQSQKFSNLRANEITRINVA